VICNEADINCTTLTDIFRKKNIIDCDDSITDMQKAYHCSEGSLAFTLSLKYLKKQNNAPASVFVKLDKTRGGEHYKKLTRNELAFYKLSQGCDFGSFIPKYIDGWYNDDFSYLILEDLSSAYISQDYASDYEYFQMAVKKLAKFHSYCWKLGIYKTPVPAFTPVSGLADLDLIVENHEKMLLLLNGTLDERLKSTLNDALSFLKSNVKQINQTLQTRRFTVIHGDFHLKNCMFLAENPHNDLKIIDWQWWNLGIGTYDVAHLLNLYLPVELKFAELNIFKLYFERLCECSFADYSWDEALNDYRIFTMLNLFKPDLYAINCRLRRQKDFWTSFINNIAISYNNINSRIL